MATVYTYGFSVTESHQAADMVQVAVADLVNQIVNAGHTPDWTTLAMVKKDLSTGWSQMPSVTAYNVLLSSNE